MAVCGSRALLLLAGLACIAAQLPTGFTKSSVISGLYNPIDIEYLPDGTMMIVLRHGVIAQLKNGAAVTYLDISQVVDSNGEKGLMFFPFLASQVTVSTQYFMSLRSHCFLYFVMKCLMLQGSWIWSLIPSLLPTVRVKQLHETIVLRIFFESQIPLQL